jgi:hypothetical protein
MRRRYIFSALIFLATLGLGVVAALLTEKPLVRAQPSIEPIVNSVHEFRIPDARFNGGWRQLQFEYDCTTDTDSPPLYAVFRVTNAGTTTVYFVRNRLGEIDITLGQASFWHKDVKAEISESRLLPGESARLWVPMPRKLEKTPFEFLMRYRVVGEQGIQFFATGSMGTQRKYDGCPAYLRT